MAAPRIEAFVAEGLGNSTYLVASGDDALVVDPRREVRTLLETAASWGVRIRTVVETHVHNDYVSGAHEIRSETGASLVLPAGGRYEFDHTPAAEGDRLALGDVGLVAMATPGHTPEHLAWVVQDDG